MVHYNIEVTKLLEKHSYLPEFSAMNCVSFNAVYISDMYNHSVWAKKKPGWDLSTESSSQTQLALRHQGLSISSAFAIGYGAANVHIHKIQ